MKAISFLPSAVVFLAVVCLAVAASPSAIDTNEMHLQEFGRLPVADGGRIKPMDTLARDSLMAISQRQSYYDNGAERPAIQWLIEVMTEPMLAAAGRGRGDSAQRRAFHIDDPQLQSLLELPRRPDCLYSFAEIQRSPHVKELLAEFKRVRENPEKTDHDAKVSDLDDQVVLYGNNVPYESAHQIFRIDNDQVLNLLHLDPRSGSRYSFSEILPRLSYLVREAQRAGKRDPKDQDVFDVQVLQLANRAKLYLGLAQMTTVAALPSVDGNAWRGLDALMDKNSPANDPAARAYEAIFMAYLQKDAPTFNRKVSDYHNWLASQMPGDASDTGFEVFLNHFTPFYWCAVMYFLAFILVCLGWLGLPSELNRAAFYLILVSLVVHVFGLLARMHISHRPFVMVTNLYSSAVFIGCIGAGLGLALEVLFRDGIGNAVAAIVAFATSIVAHHLADGDTLEMMQAVLDTNFWLATHVTCVTVGYSSTIVAGVLGIIFIAVAFINNGLTQHAVKTLGQCIYGIICFATLFSFVGTVLGGIWADQSWGRFWGWDPKENGALIIVLWNAMILHARWGGMIKQRGMAVLAVGGNIVTAWSWFGVNMLGVGLHAYGFMSGAVPWLVGWCAVNLAVMFAGILPLQLWRYAARSQPAKPQDSSDMPAGKRRRQPAVEGSNA